MYVWYGLVHDLILYDMVVFLVKFSNFVPFILMSAIYLVNKDY